MEIQKIFSNVENPEENLYSVLMDEEELSLFSELQKEFGDRGLKDAILGSHVGYVTGDMKKNVYSPNDFSLNGVTLDNNLKSGKWKKNLTNPTLHNRILKDTSHPLHEKFAANVRAGRAFRKTGKYLEAAKFLR